MTKQEIWELRLKIEKYVDDERERDEDTYYDNLSYFQCLEKAASALDQAWLEYPPEFGQ